MKPIRLTQANVGKIDAQLRQLHRGAIAHTATGQGLVAAAAKAEKVLDAMLLPVKFRPSAAATFVSGTKMPSSYGKKGYNVIRTDARMERRATGWFLVSISRYDAAYDSDVGLQVWVSEFQEDVSLKLRRRTLGYQVVAPGAI